MVSRQEIADKINLYLKRQISDKEVDAWALDVIVHETDNDSIESLITGQALALLNMLHDEDPRFRVSDRELEEVRDILLDKKSYQLNRFIKYNFTHLFPELPTKIKEATASLLTSVPPNLNKLIEECQRSNPGTVSGLLLRQVASLFEVASRTRRPEIVEPFVTPDYATGTVHIPLTELIQQLQNIYSCLVGQRAFLLTIVGEPGQPHQINLFCA